jgi:hypothetical protein
MAMKEFNLLHAEALYLRFCAIYGEKFVKSFHTDDFKKMWHEEWCSGLKGIDVDLIKGCLDHCKINLEWPPSIAEFRRICEESSGIPSFAQAMQSAIRREFNHPVIALAYEKVGSWAMRNDKEAELKPKFQTAYTEALNEFRVNPEKTWAQLESLNEKIALPEPPSKIPSTEERMGFKERLAHYQELSKIAKSKLEAKDHPTWDINKITRGSTQFDQQLFNERREYLIGMDEYLAGTLPVGDWYDRTRYLSEIEAQNNIKNNPPRPEPSQSSKTSHRSFNGSKTAYTRWTD